MVNSSPTASSHWGCIILQYNLCDKIFYLCTILSLRKDPCFRSLESLLSEALPVLLHKPRLLVLAANLCTLGLMIGRLKPAPKGELTWLCF